MKAAFWKCGIVGLLMAIPGNLLCAGSEKAAALDVEWDELQPGLVAHYRSLVDRSAALYRIDAKPAFYLGHSSPHPRLPPGRFEVVWTGVLNLADPAPVTFDAHVCGEVTIEVNGVTVLKGRGERATAHVRSREPLRRTPGLYRLTIHFTSIGNHSQPD
jgi:hypothetical protein